MAKYKKRGHLAYGCLGDYLGLEYLPGTSKKTSLPGSKLVKVEAIITVVIEGPEQKTLFQSEDIRKLILWQPPKAASDRRWLSFFIVGLIHQTD